VSRNTFDLPHTGGSGVHISSVAKITVDNNVFKVKDVGVYVLNGAPLVERNRFEAIGDIGVRLGGGAALVQYNIFSAYSFTNSAIYAISGSPTLRNNALDVSTGIAVKISSGSTPDLGTDIDGGNNKFSNVEIINYTGNDRITAKGNLMSFVPTCANFSISGLGGIDFSSGTIALLTCP